MSWTTEKVKKLKDLWTKGYTASQIALTLGDTTRNAVIGKAHRLDLEARAPSKQSSSRQESRPVKKVAQSMSRKSKFQSILLAFKSSNIIEWINKPSVPGLIPIHSSAIAE